MRGFVYCDLYYTQPKVVVVTQLMKKMHSANSPTQTALSSQ